MLADLRAGLIGVAASVALVLGVCCIAALMSSGECHGETTPYIGSARQAHVTPYCLLKNEGWLFGVKQRLGIYDPQWKAVIK